MAVPEMARKVVAEFLGTFFLVLCVSQVVSLGSAVGPWGGVAIASMLTVFVYAMANVSGSNFNPAVSLGLALLKKLPPKDAAAYMVSQLAGGASAALLHGMYSGGPSGLAAAAGYSVYQAGLAEMLYTCMLVFVVLNCAVSELNTPNQYFGLAIGFVIVAGAYGVGSISGGCFNPAVAFAITAASGFEGAVNLCIWVAFEFLGAGLAVGLYLALGAGKTPGLPQKCVAEAAGTFFLMLTIGMNVLTRSPAGAFSIAASLMCMVFSLGSVSGANFNPAVTAGIMMSGRNKLPNKADAAYMASQILGAGVAAVAVWALTQPDTAKLAVTFGVPSGGNGPLAAAATAEFLGTFVLVFVVLSVAVVEQTPLTAYFGLAIGLCITASGVAIGPISGGFMNPAVSCAVGLGGLEWRTLIYIAAQLLGGELASVVFALLQPQEYEGYKELSGP